MVVVTSFSPAGYEQYGRRFLETFAEHWDCRCVVYYDGKWADYCRIAQYAPRTKSGDIVWHPIETVKHYEEWFDVVEKIPLFRGELFGKYKIQYDARMVRKAFIQCHALEQFGGKVFWLDADSVTFRRVPEGFLDRLLPDDKFCCYLGRDYMYTESGFLGFNADHPLASAFIEAYRDVFLSGLIFTQKAWHDCIGFDMVRKNVSGVDDPFVNLASPGNQPDGTHEGLHVWCHSPLADRIDHLKGNRKKQGFSPENQYVAAFK